MSNNFINVNNENKVFVEGSDSLIPTLKPALYECGTLQDGRVVFKTVDFNSDEILDLPSNAMQSLLSEIDVFLDPKTKTRYKELGFIYKRSALLYGEPGMGKTCLIKRISQTVVERGGVVLFPESTGSVVKALSVLKEIQKDTTVLVILEELDSMHESSQLLSLLDGEIQKDNVMYLATTNFIDNISHRLKRPGRFSKLVELKAPNAESRKVYLESKFDNKVDISNWVDKTAGLSLDAIKEAVCAVECLGYDLDKVIASFKNPNVTASNEEEEDDFYRDEIDYRHNLTGSKVGDTTVPHKVNSKGKTEYF